MMRSSLTSNMDTPAGPQCKTHLIYHPIIHWLQSSQLKFEAQSYHLQLCNLCQITEPLVTHFLLLKNGVHFLIHCFPDLSSFQTVLNTYLVLEENEMFAIEKKACRAESIYYYFDRAGLMEALCSKIILTHILTQNYINTSKLSALKSYQPRNSGQFCHEYFSF